MSKTARWLVFSLLLTAILFNIGYEAVKLYDHYFPSPCRVKGYHVVVKPWSAGTDKHCEPNP